MYGEALGRRSVRPKINYIMIILFLIIIFFSIRVIGVLKTNKERGGFAYVQLLNLGMPLVENQIYNEGAYAENKLSLKNVFIEAAGLNNIDKLKLISNEVALYNPNMHNGIEFNSTSEYGNKEVASSTIDISAFNLTDDLIQRVEKGNITSGAYDPSLKKVLDPSKVEVLIYHTHTTENYAEAAGDTLDERYSVVGVGNVIEEELENNYGISVIHDKTNHSVSYNDSYKRSNETVNAYLKKYGDFKMIIDLHRDSVENKASVTANINGENVATLMFVTTRNSSRFAKNQALAEELLNKSNDLFPGLVKKIYTYNRGMNAFNENLSDGSMLIECGANINTSAEAQTSGRYIARLIAEHINRK